MFGFNRRKRPLSVQASFTERCNLRCVHCDIWKKKPCGELTLEEWVVLLRKLKSWLGCYRLDISGGEPFIRSDTLALIEFCSENGITPVVTTNAALISDEAAKKLAMIPDLTLNISLDGASSAVHDGLRGAAGIYEKVLRLLGAFKADKKKCHITLATILMGSNVSEVMGILDLVRVHGLADGINFQALDNNFSAPVNPRWQEQSLLWPGGAEKQSLLSMIDRLIDLKEQGAAIYNSVAQLRRFKEYFSRSGACQIPVCASADSNFIIRPDGKALLCWNLEPVGDCLVQEPEKIWHSSLAAQRAQQIRRCPRSCRILNCNFNL